MGGESREGNPDCVANECRRDEQKGEAKKGKWRGDRKERVREKWEEKKRGAERRKNTGKVRNSKGLGSLKNKRTDGYEEEDMVIPFKAGTPMSGI